MFGLLNPLALWLAPLIAAPLIIHWLGREPPRARDFPSLLLVRGKLAQAMRRHRVKNWWQLLLRTLVLLLLVLSAANPVWRLHFGGAGLPSPQAAGLLLANDAYGAVPAGRTTVLRQQDHLRRSLDSLTAGHCTTEPLLRDATVSPAARLGRYAEGVTQLLRRAGSAASFQLYLPVFAWSDLEAVRGTLAQALRAHPGWRLVLTEYPEAAAALSPFGDLHLAFPKPGFAEVRARRRAGVADFANAVWTPVNASPQTVPAAADSFSLTFPLPPSGWMAGELAPPAAAAARFAFAHTPISLRVPAPATLCHVGNPFASLASLGQGGLRLHVQTLASPQALQNSTCDVLYLADPAGLDADALERAAEILRGGGKVIVGLGRNTDPSLLNRGLLEPLQVGRLTTLASHAAKAVRPETAALARLGWPAAAWGDPGNVNTEITFIPDPGTAVLLTAGGDPILAYRQVGRGALLLWTTDVNNPDWTDLGLGPWLALVHQAFAAGTWSAGSGLLEVASDSVFHWSGAEDTALRVRDPQGAEFFRVRRDPGGWSLGPFDRLGIYSVATGSDTLRLAVRLQPGPAPAAAAWKGERARFLAEWGALRPRLFLRRADAAGPLYGGWRLRTALLVTAALLLLLEGFISLRLAPGRPAAARE